MPDIVIQSVSSIRYKLGNIQIKFVPEETLEAVYCKFRNFREKFIFAQTSHMQSFLKMKSLQNREITLLITDIG